MITFQCLGRLLGSKVKRREYINIIIACMRKQTILNVFFITVSEIITKKVLDFCVELVYNVRYFLEKEKTKWPQAQI